MSDKELLMDLLVSGDRPSIYALGWAGMEMIKRTKMAVFMVDALGRVQLMDPNCIQVLKGPKIEDKVLHALSEEQAVKILQIQGDGDEDIISYLKRRDENAKSNL